MYVMLERKTIQGFRMVELGEYTDLRVHLFKNEQTKDIRECINDALLLVWNNSRPHCNIGWRKITKKNAKLIEKPFERIKRKFDWNVLAKNEDAYSSATKNLRDEVMQEVIQAVMQRNFAKGIEVRFLRATRRTPDSQEFLSYSHISCTY